MKSKTSATITPFRAAWITFINGEGRDCVDPTTLGLSDEVRRSILENRLHAAFCAGWNQRENARAAALAATKEV